MGEEALRCAARAERRARASAQAERAAERAAERVAERSGAERSKALCALVDLAHLRVGGGLRMRGAAGVQLYFPREDDDDMFICQTSPPSFSRSPHMGSQRRSNTIEF